MHTGKQCTKGAGTPHPEASPACNWFTALYINLPPIDQISFTLQQELMKDLPRAKLHDAAPNLAKKGLKFLLAPLDEITQMMLVVDYAPDTATHS